MPHKYAEIAFTPSVQAVQKEQGSHRAYSAMYEGPDVNSELGPRERDFIADRDSFYMASVSETGWPYLQHRGGPRGFVRVLNSSTLGFADFQGNRQYVSVGNLRKDPRVSLFFMDYPNQTRLKLFGRVRFIDGSDVTTLAKLESPDYRAVVERGFLIDIVGFDWNCPQHITPRYTESQVAAAIAPLKARISALETQEVAESWPQSIGDGPLQLVITGIRQLSARVRAYELRSLDGDSLPPVEAGSHLEVPWIDELGKTQSRNYSICSNPSRRDCYEIAILREDEGRGGSKRIHQRYSLGQVLNCSMPRNHFSLEEGERPFVLVAGGIGITAIKPMAQVLKAQGRGFELHYAGKYLNDMVFSERLQRDFEAKIRLYPSDRNIRLNLEELFKSVPDNALFYICGPESLLAGAQHAAKAVGVDQQRLQFERFHPADAAGNQTFNIEIRSSGLRVEVAEDQSTLDAMLEAGLDIPYSCLSGSCRSCKTRVLKGKIDHRDQALSDEERKQGWFCPCVSRSRDSMIRVDL